MKYTRLVIVDDHVMLRDGIVSIFNEQPDFDVVGQAGSVASALKVVRSTMPDLVLMDYGLPDGTGLDAAKEILASYPQTDIVILTVHEEDDLLFGAIRSGVKGYLLKNISSKEMLSRLRGLSRGDVAIMPAERRRIFSEFAKTAVSTQPQLEDAVPLTEREQEVLQMLADGASNKEIGVQLHISVHTVKNHVHNILEKLQVSNRYQAVEVASKRGLIKTRKL